MAPGLQDILNRRLKQVFFQFTSLWREHPVTPVMSPNVGLETRHNCSNIARRKSCLITTLSQVSSFLLHSHYVLKSRLLHWHTWRVYDCANLIIVRSRYNKSLCEESKGLKWGLSVQISLGQNSQQVAAPSFPNSLSYPAISRKHTSKLAKNNKKQFILCDPFSGLWLAVVWNLFMRLLGRTRGFETM